MPITGDGLTLLQLCRAYVEALQRGEKFSARRVSYQLERHIATRPIGQRLARDIQPKELTELLKEVIRNHGEKAGKDLRSYLSTAYQRAIDAKTSLKDSEIPVDDGLIWNPLTQIRPPEGGGVRERVLKNSELRAYWTALNASEHAADLAHRAARLSLLLGGQRCEQLLRVKTLDVDLEAGTIRLFDPKGKRKSPRPHLLPLLPMARAEVGWLLEHSRALGSEWLFASRADCRMIPSTVSKAVHKIYLSMKKDGTAAAHFQFSDLRRTVTTYFSEQDVPEKVHDHLQSHGLSPQRFATAANDGAGL